jgi:hypothetical protein
MSLITALSVINVMKRWVEFFFSDFESDRSLLQKLYAFIDHSIATSQGTNLPKVRSSLLTVPLSAAFSLFFPFTIAVEREVPRVRTGESGGVFTANISGTALDSSISVSHRPRVITASRRNASCR